ncbi:UNVERIFIED_CONTAM: hypothetical protein FKN15_056139 [Acipenser sinensis]
MLADVGQRLIYPPEIATTNLRPAIVLWYGSARLVHLEELTVSWEDAVDEAYARNKLWYAQLAAEAEQQGWRVRVYPVEAVSLPSARKIVSAIFLPAQSAPFKAQCHSQLGLRFHQKDCSNVTAVLQLFPTGPSQTMVTTAMPHRVTTGSD